MPKLLLHIGTHKTGTTSIQRFCGANRDALRQRGVWYPNASVGPFPDHYAHHRIAHAIAGRDDQYTRTDAADFFKRVRKQARADETVLISAEPMYRHQLADRDEASPSTADFVEAREDRMVRYARAVRDCTDAFDVTVLVMLRRQDLFAESLYAEQVLSTGYVKQIERFIDERDHLLDYRRRLDVWCDVFGEDRISVRVFERSSMGPSIEHVFVDWLGLEWSDELRVGRRHNVTPTRTLVEFKRIINIQGQSNEVNNLYRRWVERLAGRLPPDELNALGRFYLQPRERLAVLRRHAEGNQEVARRFLDRDELFLDAVTDELVDYVDRPQLGQKRFRELTQQLLAMVADEIGPA